MRPRAVCVRAHIAATQRAKFMSSTIKSNRRLQKPEGGEKSTYMRDVSFSIARDFFAGIVTRNDLEKNEERIFFFFSVSLTRLG